jgi:hypothetical protein
MAALIVRRIRVRILRSKLSREVTVSALLGRLGRVDRGCPVTPADAPTAQFCSLGPAESPDAGARRRELDNILAPVIRYAGALFC